MAINKIVYGNQTLIDLTGDTVTAAGLAQGLTAHDKSGALITGQNTYDADTTDADASAGEILSGQTAYVNGIKLTGTMPNLGAAGGTISTKAEEYSIGAGYHDGSGKVGIDAIEQAKIIPENIKEGVELLGVTGTYTGEGVTAQSKTVTPYTTQQTVLPDSGYDYLTQVTVGAIEYQETANSYGTTVTIGTVAPTP